MDLNFKLDDRIYVNDKSGTIKFIGNTKFQEGLWVGVALDEPHGKNNGTVQEVEYFKCEESHGLFCKLSQISRDKKPKSRPSSITSRPSSRMERPVSRATIEKPSSKSVSDVRTNRRSMELSTSRPPSRLSSAPVLESPKLAQLESQLILKDKTIANLTDQMSILSELETQVNDLLAQKNKEIQLKNDLKSKLSLQQSEFQSQVTALENEISQLKSIKPAPNTPNNDLQSNYESLLSQFEDLKSKKEIEIKSLQAQLDEQLELMALDDPIVIDQQPPKDNISQTSLLDQIELLTLDKEYAEEQCDYYKHEIDELKASLTTLDMKYKELTSGNTELPVLQDQLINLKQHVISLQNNNQALKNDINQLKEASEECNKLKNDVLNLKTINSELLLQLDTINDHDTLIHDLTESNLSLTTQIDLLKSEIVDLEALKEISEEIEQRYCDAVQELNKELQQYMTKEHLLNTTIQQQQACILQLQNTISKLNDKLGLHSLDLESLQLQNTDKSEELSWLQQQSNVMLKMNVKLHKETITVKQDLINKQLVESASKHLHTKETMLMPYMIKNSGQELLAIEAYTLILNIISKFDIFNEYLQLEYSEIDDVKIQEIRELCRFNMRLFLIKSRLMLFREAGEMSVDNFMKLPLLKQELKTIEHLINTLLDLVVHNEFNLTVQYPQITRIQNHLFTLQFLTLNDKSNNMFKLQGIGHLADVLNSDLELIGQQEQMEQMLRKLREILQGHYEIKGHENVKLIDGMGMEMESLIAMSEEYINNEMGPKEKILEMENKLSKIVETLGQYRPQLGIDMMKEDVEGPWVIRSKVLQAEYVEKSLMKIEMDAFNTKINDLTRELLHKEEEIDGYKQEILIVNNKKTSAKQNSEGDLQLKKQIKGYMEQEMIYEEAIDGLHLEIHGLQEEIKKLQEIQQNRQIQQPLINNANSMINGDLLMLYKGKLDKLQRRDIDEMITYIDEALPELLKKRLKFKQDCRQGIGNNPDVFVNENDHMGQLLHFYSTARVMPINGENDFVIKQQLKHAELLHLVQ